MEDGVKESFVKSDMLRKTRYDSIALGLRE